MKLFALSIGYDVGMLIFFGIWLWVLVWRRDLWLRCTAAEEAFWLRLHLPLRFATANRRFAEGRTMVYCVAVCLIISLVFFTTSVGMLIYFEHHRPHAADGLFIVAQIFG
jgi:hypothetical protein